MSFLLLLSFDIRYSFTLSCSTGVPVQFSRMTRGEFVLPPQLKASPHQTLSIFIEAMGSNSSVINSVFHI